MKCRVPECDSAARTQGLCHRDYMLARKYGDYTVKPDRNDTLRAYNNHPNVIASINSLAAMTGISRYSAAQAVRFK